MKYFALSLLWSCLISGYAQQSYDIENLLLQGLIHSTFTWKASDPSEGLKTRKFLLQYPELLNCAESIDESFYAQFHWVDLNQDGKKDLVFEGPCLPYDEVHVYLATATGYLNVLGKPGRLIQFGEIAGNHSILIRREACCCNYWSEVELFEIGEQITRRGSLKVHSQTLSYVDPDLVFWDHLKAATIGAVDTSRSGTLRTEETINNQLTRDPCTGDPVSGNFLGEWTGRRTEFLLSNPIFRGDW